MSWQLAWQLTGSVHSLACKLPAPAEVEDEQVLLHRRQLCAST